MVGPWDPLQANVTILPYLSKKDKYILPPKPLHINGFQRSPSWEPQKETAPGGVDGGGLGRTTG